MPQDNTGSDSVLGNQGASDFASLTTMSGANGAQSGGGAGANVQSPPNNQGRNDQQTGTLPSKTAAEVQDGTTAQGDAGQGGDTGQTQTPTPGQQQQQTPPAQQQNQQQSTADIIKATAEALVAAQGGRQGQQQNPPQEQQLTPEQFNQKYGVVQVTEQHMAAILGQDAKHAAATLNGIIQAAVKQAALMTLDVADARIGKVKSEFEPHISSWQKHQNEIKEQKAEQEFFKAYPDLAVERELVMEMKDAVLAKVNAGQLRFNSPQEAFNAVATATRNILKRMSPGGTGTQSGQQQGGQGGGQQTPSPATRQMSGASSSGRSGTGQAAVKSDVESVFGADAR